MRYDNVTVRFAPIGHPDNFHAGLSRLDGIEDGDVDILYPDMATKWMLLPRQLPCSEMTYMSEQGQDRSRSESKETFSRDSTGSFDHE